jgi:hypothetical protein
MIQSATGRSGYDDKGTLGREDGNQDIQDSDSLSQELEDFDIVMIVMIQIDPRV